MDLNKQNRAPICEALERFRKRRVVPFDVPGHKRGRGNPELTQLFGERCVGLDVNSMKPLDNLCNPVSVIAQAEALTADAFGAAHAFLMVGGTTSAVQAMVLSVCKAGDKIILPRNVHKSVINALILCGAVPVYINPKVHPVIGVALGIEVDALEETIAKNPDAVAVFINNPTYYGICSNLKALTETAHRHGIKVLCDEAHGTHLYFGDHLPMAGMRAGGGYGRGLHAQVRRQSDPELGAADRPGYGSGPRPADHQPDPDHLRQLPAAGQPGPEPPQSGPPGPGELRQGGQNGRVRREEINHIGGYYAYGKELIDGSSVYDFDVTKLCVYTKNMGLTGIEVYDLMRDEYDIQIEFGDIGNIMAYISIGDRLQDIERLVGALADIKRLYQGDAGTLAYVDSVQPEVACSPQFSFYSEKESLPIRETAGRVCGEFVMCYPPGIPILAPGERITEDIIDHILYAREKGCSLQGAADPRVDHVQVLKGV